MNTLERIISLRASEFASDAAFERALGVKPKTVDSWKRGNSDAYMKMLPEIASALKTTTSYLLGETDDPTPQNEKAPVTSTGALKEYFHNKTGREPTSEELSQIEKFADTFIKGMDK